jgi:AraC-like DNA-binding protein
VTPKLVARFRRQLWQGGYRPVAIYSANAPVDDAGKRPTGERWQERARRDPPAVVVEPIEPIALNTGILTDGLRAVDLDIDDPALARELREVVETRVSKTIIRWRRNSSRSLLLYRAADGAPSKRMLKGELGKIEVLGLGQQFVAFGTHPSGAPLLWQPGGPDKLPRCNVPVISEDEITELFEIARPMIRAEKPSARSSGGPASGYRPNARSLAGLVRGVATAPEGERNNVAFWAACRAGEMVAAGLLDSETAVALITEAAVRAGLPQPAAMRTAFSGVLRTSGAARV